MERVSGEEQQEELLSVLAASASNDAPVRPRVSTRIRDDPTPRAPGALYAYQEAAYALLESDEPINLLVASPTGSGKTSVIERAAKLCMDKNEKMVVAEPLIALVEQIHARLSRAISRDHVEMRTGPSVRQARDAQVSVCTYEVLASCCGSNDAIMLERCGRVAIDEFHFISTDRGPVLQEILDWCRTTTTPVVALSGTLVNEMEVADFLSGVNGLRTVIVGASRRPVPLNYYFYDACCRRFWHMRDFGCEETRRLARAQDQREHYGKVIGGIVGRQDILQLIEGLRCHDSFPALVVNFSCKKLDEWAEHAASGNDFLSRRQRSLVVRSFRDALREVPEEDHVLFDRLYRLAKQGIGLHHSHLPVQYLDIVSDLAEKRCLMVVFSTSTLSAGINLPVRTVCICTSRMPRKVDGEIQWGVVDPLLLHQLAGRAGRPGYETYGNVVVIGKGWDGYYAAHALFERPLPAIRPNGEFNIGDILRAARTGRCLALDRLTFSNSHAARTAEKAQRSKALAWQALAALESEGARNVARSCADSVEVIIEARNVRDVQTPVQGAVNLWIRDAARLGFCLSEDSGDIQISSKSRSTSSSSSSTKVHLSVFDLACRVKNAKNSVLNLWLTPEEHLRSPDVQLVSSVLKNCRDDVRELEQEPDQAAYSAIETQLKRGNFLDATGALTRLGRAASLVRSCASPHTLIEIIEQFEQNELSYVKLASLAIEAGATGASDEAPNDDDDDIVAPGEDVLRERLASPSTCPFNRAALAWARGASLAHIEETVGVSCGQMARHAVQINTLLCEIGLARRELGLDDCPALDAASRAVCRGLPFARRSCRLAGSMRSANDLRSAGASESGNETSAIEI